MIASPAASAARPCRARGGAVTDAAAKAAAVVAFPEAKACSSADRINLAREPVTTQAHLPLRRPGRAARELDRTWTVVLSAADCGRVRIISKIAADVACVELDRVNAGVHVEPGVSGSVPTRPYWRWCCREDAAVAALRSNTGRAGHECQRVLINMHAVFRRGIAARGIVPRRCRCGVLRSQTRFRRCRKDAIGVVRIDGDALVVPVLRIVAGCPLCSSGAKPPAEPESESKWCPPSVMAQTPSWQPFALPQPLF